MGPPDRPGPGVLLLCSWWGLTSTVRRRADQVADRGFTVLAPDLAFGHRADTEAEAETMLGELDPNHLVRLVLTSSELLAQRARGTRMGVVGVGMGGSMALWLSVRRPDLVAGAVSICGSQTIDFVGATASYQLHLADSDRFISDDDAAFLEATMRMEGLSVDVVRHAGTRHGFVDPESDAHDATAAAAAWAGTVDFLRLAIPTG